MRFGEPAVFEKNIHPRAKLLLGVVEMSEENVESGGLLTEVLDGNARAVDDLASFSSLVILAEANPLTELLAILKKNEKKTLVLFFFHKHSEHQINGTIPTYSNLDELDLVLVAKSLNKTGVSGLVARLGKNAKES